jgi:polysaccharide biosynthesis protein PslH
VKRILVVSTIPSHPQNSGNRARIGRLCEELLDAGHDVRFVWIRQPGEPGIAALRGAWRGKLTVLTRRPGALGERLKTWYRNRVPSRLQVLLRRALRRSSRAAAVMHGNIAIDDWFPLELTGAIDGLLAAVKPDVVIVEYVFLSRLLVQVPRNVTKIIDTHDVFTDRFKTIPGWFSTTADDEITGLMRADRVIAISERDAQSFRRACTVPVTVVGHLVKEQPTRRMQRAITVQATRIGFYASDYAPNHEGFSWLVREVFPKLVQGDEQFAFVVSGSIAPALAGELPAYVRVIPGLSPSEFYEQVDIVVIPILRGSGVSVKMIESLAHAKATVATTAGARGFHDGAGEAYLCADSAADFARSLKTLLRRPADVERLEAAARNYHAHYNREMRRRLAEVVN